MPDASKSAIVPPLDYDPEVAEQIEELLEQLRKSNDMEERTRIKKQLSTIIFGS